MKDRNKNQNDSLGDTKEIVDLKDYRQAEVSFVYEDETEAKEEESKKVKKVSKALYRVGGILLLVIIVLAIWINRDNLKPENIWNWVVAQTVGSGSGDGFPVALPGSSVPESNFSESNGMAAILSDTAFTLISSSGKEQLSLNHGFSNPAMTQAEDCFLLYNAGSTGYILQSGGDTLIDSATENDIICAAVAQNGRYALGVQSSDSASSLEVYDKDGDLLYTYSFAQDYITCVALNYDGSFGAVGTVYSNKGEMISKITVLDFTQTERVTEYSAHGNLLLGMHWSRNGMIYAVGDTAVLTADSSDYIFTEYSYNGRQLTAYHFDADRAFVSSSAYDYSGAGSLLVFDGNREYVRIETDEHISSISVQGGNVAVLEKSQVNIFDYSTGVQLASADAGADARSIALMNERTAYVMCINEVRTLELEQ